MKPIATTLCAALVLGNIAFASSDDLPPSYKPSIHQMIVKSASVYHAKESVMKAIIACESSNDPTAHKLTSRENSWGLVQINLKAHPDITEEQATDPQFAIDYLAKNLSTHPTMWSCYSKVK